MYDVIIIGMGISGISAGIYAKQANLNVLMFESRMPGGLLNNIDKISNFAGKKEISGPDFAMDLFNQVNDEKIPYKNEEIIKVELDGKIKKVYTKKEVFETKNLIIATGRRPRFLGLPNEKKLLGRGLSTCALCDGHFYKNKNIVIVGGGNSALQESIYLSNLVKCINIIIRKNKFSGSESLINKVLETKNINIVYEDEVEEILENNEIVSGVKLKSGKEIICDGIFMYTGWVPNSDLIKEYELTNRFGYIEVDDNLETNINRVYAVGDIIKKDMYQLINAAAEGALVIHSILKR